MGEGGECAGWFDCNTTAAGLLGSSPVDEPAEPVRGCKGGGNPWYDAIPEPKHEGDPQWLIDKVVALEQPDHGLGGLGAHEGDTTPGLFPDPAKCDEFVPKP